MYTEMPATASGKRNDPVSLSPDFVTVATSATGKLLTKQVSLNPDGSVEVQDYGGETWFTFEHVPLGDNMMAGLWRVLDGLSPQQMIVHGAVRDGADASRAYRRTHDPNTHQHPTLEDTAHLWHVQDVDKIPAVDEDGDFDPVKEPERAARQIRRMLPLEFHDAFCIWRLSSSAGFKQTDGKLTINMRM